MFSVANKDINHFLCPADKASSKLEIQCVCICMCT